MLSILGSIYGMVADLRNALYDKGVFEVFDTRARTISIGNITAGGTGKTPLVAYVANVLASRGEKVCILTRGYGREHPGQRVLVSDGEAILTDARSAGDEPYELARKLLGKAVVISDADRVAAAEWAARKFAVTAFVLDDGFQHRKVKRDLDIVCIDATDPFGGRKMLPSGRLREPLHNLSRADVIVITRANLVDDTAALRGEIGELNPDAAIFQARTNACRIEELQAFHAKVQTAPHPDQQNAPIDLTAIERFKNIGAFCALGNPDAFFNQVGRALGLKTGLKFKRHFPDHHRYSQSDIQIIERDARTAGADALITTAKDAVKLGSIELTLPCFVLEIETVVDIAGEFDAMI